MSLKSIKICLPKITVHLVFLSLTIFGRVAFAFCEVERVNDQLSTVHLSSDRQIILMGHNHGSNDSHAQLAKMARDQASPNSEFVFEITKLLASLNTTYQHYADELDALEVLVERANLDFIALEEPQEFSVLMNKMSEDFPRMLEENIHGRGITNRRILEVAHLIFVGPGRYLLDKHPSLKPRVHLVSVERQSLLDGSVKLFDEITKEEERILPSIPYGLQPVIQRLLNRVTTEYESHTDLNHEWIRAELRKAVPPLVFDELQALLDLKLRLADSLRKRDYAIVKTLREQQGSGVLLIGYSHIRSLNALLQRSCP